MIFVDDVTWFCEDCKEKVADTPNDPPTCLPSRTSESLNLGEDAIQARREITICIKQVKENKQQLQNIIGNICEEEDKVIKEYQPFKNDSSKSNDGSVTVENSQIATKDDLNLVELDGYVDSQPIADPIWR